MKNKKNKMNYKSKSHKSFSNKGKSNMNKGKKSSYNFESFSKPEDIELGSINFHNKGKKYNVRGMIEKVVQTGGPTIFFVSDGTGTLALKGFDSPGERAHPDIDVDDTVNAIVEIGEYNGEIEGEIKKVSKLSDKEHERYLKKIIDIQRNRAKIKPVPFLVNSKILSKLKDRMIKAAEEIRLAIIQSRPIIVRHHNDTDGYSSGYSLERAILPLIEKEQTSEKAAWEFFLRAPCQAPFYEIEDSIRDAALSLRNMAKYSNKMPLVIIADNGSSPEDLLAIKHGKIHGMEFIVIDHHFFDVDVISKEVLTHINPFLVGEDGASYSAGMLCSELARLINPDIEINGIPAMAGLADRIDLNNPGDLNKYIKLAEKDGYTKDLLYDISLVIDYVSSKIRFMEVREYIEVIFGEPRKKQKQLVDLMAPHIKNLEEKGIEIARTNGKCEKLGKVTLQTLDIEEIIPRFGFYPRTGILVGLIHDDVQKTKKIESLVTIGIMASAITIRATDKANFSVHELIKKVNKEVPTAFVEGGGHKNAGSIGFIPNKRNDVIKVLKKFIKERNN